MRIVGIGQRGRRVLGTLVAVAALAALGGLVIPQAQASGQQIETAMLDLTGWTRLAAVAPGGIALAAPLPGVADGVGPGSFLVIHRGTSVGACTANFVWKSTADASKAYLGAAGHCFLDEDQASAPDANQRVEVCVSSCRLGGASGLIARGVLDTSYGGNFVDLGPVVYARQQSANGTEVGHDFGLVEIPSGIDFRKNVPVWGGPTGTGGIGDQVCLYGNAVGVGEVFATKARSGLGLFETDGAWFAAIPSAPGDSGAAVVNCIGTQGTSAVGILTHVTGAGIAGTTVAQAMAMFAADNPGKTISLVTS